MLLNGKDSPMSDEVFSAACSDDLPRMLRALEQPADPIARHYLLQNIVMRAYKLRHQDDKMRELCEQVARRHLSEFEPIAMALKDGFAGSVPSVPSFRCLATILVEKGSYDDAIQVCEAALSFGADDGTASGFQGRAERIRNQQQAHGEGRAKPDARRKPRACPSEEIRAEHSNVPLFKCYWATTDEMDENQRRFYEGWRRAWQTGTTLPVDGNISYLFCYAYGVLERDPSVALDGLKGLIEAYQESEPHFANYCRSWVSDCYVALKKYREALDALPPLNIDSRSGHRTDVLLTLKLQVGERISGRDILTLNGPGVTAWGRQHVNTLSEYLTIIVEAYEREHEVNLLKQWAHNTYSSPFSIFAGSKSSRKSQLVVYSFSTHEPACNLLRKLTREAENRRREEIGLPKVGEGWISETNLFYEIKESMPADEVVQHASPAWLGKQHLDIFISTLGVAIEFQGAQHDQPVEYFGGLDAFEVSQRRDKLKAERCEQNGIRLIYARPGYCLDDILNEIRLSSDGG